RRSDKAEVPGSNPGSPTCPRPSGGDACGRGTPRPRAGTTRPGRARRAGPSSLRPDPRPGRPRQRSSGCGRSAREPPSGGRSGGRPRSARSPPETRCRPAKAGARGPNATRRTGDTPGFRSFGLSYIRDEVSTEMQEMLIYGVSFDLVGKQPIVLLKTADGNKFLPIWIGHPEAAAILMKLQSQPSVRPMTHECGGYRLEQLGAPISRITVTELRENTSYAQITVIQDGQEIEVASRPSDAIALAIRAEAPIFAADDVIAESAIEFEGEE